MGRRPHARETVRNYLADEATAGLDRFDHYAGFGDRVVTVQAYLRDLLERLRRQGERIAAYGAAAKGTILLNSAGIGPDLIGFVADKSPHKQGKLMPGVRIPIVPPERLLEEVPDAALLLVWNLRDEIVREQRAYLEAGGRFIVPIPEPVEIGSEALESVEPG